MTAPVGDDQGEERLELLFETRVMVLMHGSVVHVVKRNIDASVRALQVVNRDALPRACVACDGTNPMR